METAINLTAIIISVIALIISLTACILVLAMKWSTHKIEFRPLETKEMFPSEEEDDFRPFTEPDSDMVQEALKLSREGKKRKKDSDPLDEILESNNFNGSY